jgi:hypothetical protein
MSCGLHVVRVILSRWLWREKVKSCPWWYFLPSVSGLVDWQSFTHGRICPSLFQWMPYYAWPRRPHNAGLLPKVKKNQLYLSSRSLMRRNYMLDVIVVVVTLVSFLVLIGFTEGCERL